MSLDSKAEGEPVAAERRSSFYNRNLPSTYVRNMSTPFQSVLKLMAPNDEAHIKAAFYSVAGFMLVYFFGAMLITAYLILMPFLKPILWAVLLGTILHPIKQVLTVTSKKYLKDVRRPGSTGIISVLWLPLDIINAIADRLSETCSEHFKLIAGLTALFVGGQILSAGGYLVSLTNFFAASFSFGHELLEGLSHTLSFTFILGHVALTVFFWPQAQRFLQISAVAVWVVVTLNFLDLLGPMKGPTFVALVVVSALGFVTQKLKDFRKTIVVSDTEGPVVGTSTLGNIFAKFFVYSVRGSDDSVEQYQEDADSNDATTTQCDTSATQGDTVPNSPRGSKVDPEDDEFFTYYLFLVLGWLFTLTLFWSNVWLLLTVPLLGAFFVARTILRLTRCSQRLTDAATALFTSSRAAWEPRRDAIVPPFVSRALHYCRKGGRKLVDGIYYSLDEICASVTIVLLLVLLVIGTVFIIVQLHQETILLVKLTHSAFNNTIHPGMQSWLPQNDTVEEKITGVVDNVYSYGREYLSGKVDEVFVNVPAHSRTQIREQLLGLFDQLFSSWVEVEPSWSLFNWRPKQEDLSFSDWFRLLQGKHYVTMIQSNMDSLAELAQSLWLLTKTNINILMTIVSTMLNLLFVGGSALFNFIFSTVVFLTMLYYLLASSSSVYKPIEWITVFMPSQRAGDAIGTAVSRSVRGVFAATSKMAAFYGVYTWLLHRLFGCDIAFLPALGAATFAMIPVLGVYVVSIPGCLQLWLDGGRPGLAILLVILHYLPTQFVDAAIYAEIKDAAHPYITALAIVGGGYCFGVEGAIFGPLLLCFLVVAFHLYEDLVLPKSRIKKRRQSSVDE